MKLIFPGGFPIPLSTKVRLHTNRERSTIKGNFVLFTKSLRKRSKIAIAPYNKQRNLFRI